MRYFSVFKYSFSIIKQFFEKIQYTFDSAIRLSTDSETNEGESSRTIILVDFDRQSDVPVRSLYL